MSSGKGEVSDRFAEETAEIPYGVNRENANRDGGGTPDGKVGMISRREFARFQRGSVLWF